MAKKPQQQQQPSGYSRRRASLVLWASIAMVILLWFSLPTVIVFIFGMLPSFAAYVIDRSKEKYATFCVASMNFCGVFPFLMDLWLGTHSIYEATNIMADVFALVVMFGSAAIGWVIYSSMPPVISSFISVIAQQRVNSLRTQQRKLIEEWGEAVARPPERQQEDRKPPPKQRPISAPSEEDESQVVDVDEIPGMESDETNDS